MIKLVVSMLGGITLFILIPLILATIGAFIMWDLDPIVQLTTAPPSFLRMWLVVGLLFGIAWHYSD